MHAQTAMADPPHHKPSTPPQALSRIYELDGLRGIAASWVMLFHIFGSSAWPEPFSTLLLWGWSGVDLFFVLSGFLVGSILCRFRESGNMIRTFYGRRFLRIFPVYLLFIAVCYFFYEVVPKVPTPPPFSYWTYVFLLNDFVAFHTSNLGKIGLAWSLAIEEKFYLLAPLLVRFCSQRQIVFSLTLLLTASVARQWWLWNSEGPDVAFARYVFRWEGLCLGMLAALHTARVGVEYWQKGTVRLFLFGVFVIALVTTQLTGSHPTYKSFSFLLLSTAYLALVLLILGAQGKPAVRLLRSKPLVWLGTISYGTYLFHGLVGYLITGIALKLNIGTSPPEVLLLKLTIVATTLALAHLSWHKFEKHFVNTSHRLFRY